ncbi:MAG: NADH-quinone oxidoreductase subunit L [Verrucomicrobiota bacterium]
MNIALLMALVPLLPFLAAGITALLKREQRDLSASLVIGAQAISTVIGIFLFAVSISHSSGEHGAPIFLNFAWLTFGTETLRLGLLLDPLSAGMAAMVTFVTLLIFIFSHGYMKEDRNYTRFFTFLSLFSGAMLGVVLSNSLLLTFICWELVGLASYLLIGFWFHKPEAAAAAKKAFITTRVGDMGFLIGMLWLYSASGTLLFFDHGAGCLEQTALTALSTKLVFGGLAVSNAIALLIFCGAAGKSGQFPLHVWLPDAMEGPTPVSALIHAATMVAAGVFLVARMFPIFSATGTVSVALTTVAWIGAITALFAALIAVAQTDIKRILAYSTVSQLGFMMLALGVGSVAAAMLHLIAHAFFKALLFLGAGSVIHGVHEEQDIRHMGGLRRSMPVTFITYSIGMMALSGVPFLFSGFWSKDEILHAAHGWSVSHYPFYMAVAAAFLTAFYMTRQMCYVFFGSYRGHAHPHESPAVMTIPLTLLAAATVLMSIPATPAWPWFHSFITGHHLAFDFNQLFDPEFMKIAGTSIVIVICGIGLSYLIYGRRVLSATALDPLESISTTAYKWLANRLYVDELYAATVVRALAGLGALAAWVDRWIFGGAVKSTAWLSVFISRVSDGMDRFLLNFGFDSSCNALREYGGGLSALQSGQVQGYLRMIGIGMFILLAVTAWLLA